jgi:hypothetical protein
MDATGEHPTDPAARTAIRGILASLNALRLGEMSHLRAELARAEDALAGLGQADLAGRVAEARQALATGQIKEFRRAIANVTARLGHVK